MIGSCKLCKGHAHRAGSIIYLAETIHIYSGY